MKQSFGPDGPRIFEQVMEDSYTRLRAILVAHQQSLAPAKDAAEGFFRGVGQNFNMSCINLNYDDCVEMVAPYFYDSFDVVSQEALRGATAEKCALLPAMAEARERFMTGVKWSARMPCRFRCRPNMSYRRAPSPKDREEARPSTYCRHLGSPQRRAQRSRHTPLASALV
jgi:hypothetical protein